MGNAETDCQKVVGNLYPYIDGEMADAICTEIRRHLSGCTDCFDRVEFERALKALVSEKCRERAPEDLLERVRSLLRERYPRG